MKSFLQFLLFGAGFGFLLSRVGATDFDVVAGMFLLTDLHLMGVIGVAVGVAGVGLALLRRRGAVLKSKPMKPGLWVGAVLFGAGWAVTGTCPGTGLAQIGEGKWLALFTVAGVLLGSALYRAVGAQVEAALTVQRPRRSRRVARRSLGAGRHVT
jgi:uncharacterized protein